MILWKRYRAQTTSRASQVESAWPFILRNSRLKLHADIALLCYKGIEVDALGALNAVPHIGISMVKPA